MFDKKDLIFMSEDIEKKGCQSVGSLYFRTEIKNDKDEGEVNKVNVYRSRIRLVHPNGPEIAHPDIPLEEWILGDEKWFAGNGKGECYGDLVKHEMETLLKATGRTVCERYTKGGVSSKHKSRGVMILKKYNIEQEHIDKIYEIISQYTDTSGACMPDLIDKANYELSNYLSKNKLLSY